jgi:hypothetical protein
LCLDGHLAKPWIFSWADLETKAATKEAEVICNRELDFPHVIHISDIAPDLAMLDFDSRIVDVAKEVDIGKVQWCFLFLVLIFLQVLGRGGFATVYLGSLDGASVAVKIIHQGKKQTEDEDGSQVFVKVLAEFRRELKFMRYLFHFPCQSFSPPDL